MEHSVLVSGTTYKLIKSGTILNGTYYTISSGEVLVSGTAYSGIKLATPLPQDLINKLTDFKYTDNYDGTVTLTDWNKTLNGVSSTELVIPDDSRIIL